MKDKRLFILFIAGIILTVIVFLWLLFLSFSLSTPIDTQPNSLSISTKPRQPTPTPIVIPFEKPTSPTLRVNGITVDNFYKQGTIIDTNGDVSILKNRLYDIVYLAPFQEFIIEILNTPFISARNQAEFEFLKQLGITQDEACSLKVSLATPYRINPTEAGKKFDLSFCENE